LIELSRLRPEAGIDIAQDFPIGDLNRGHVTILHSCN
jgi:hypothetical protein